MTFARAAMTRVDRLDVPTVVVLGGGVLAGRDEMLLEEIRRRLAAVAPQARAVVTEVRAGGRRCPARTGPARCAARGQGGAARRPPLVGIPA